MRDKMGFKIEGNKVFDPASTQLSKSGKTIMLADIGRCDIGICNTNTDFINELDILISRHFRITGYYSSGKLHIHPSKKRDRLDRFRKFVFPQLRLERKRRKAEELNKRYSHAPKNKKGDKKEV